MIERNLMEQSTSLDEITERAPQKELTTSRTQRKDRERNIENKERWKIAKERKVIHAGTRIH